MQTADLIVALQSAGAYPDPPRAGVTVLQTHISMLFFTDDRVFKVKKPITLDFLDYSTLERRRHFCEEEVRLNRRLAPEVYLGVAPITRDLDGVIHVHGDGEVIEYAVEMVRLPDDRMMGALLDRGEIDNQLMDEIVQLLATFHQKAATGPGVDEFGRPDEIAAQLEDNLQGLDPFVRGAVLSSRLHEHLQNAARTWLQEHRELLEQRVCDGRTREGHGDLHTGNICLMRDGVVVYDCIEFSRRFRCRDVAAELAFLAMDLDFRCYRGFAAYLLHRYAELTGDPELPEVAAFYKTHLAMVRGRVACLRSVDTQLEPGDRRAARIEAMQYFHLAAAYALEPVLVVMCGLPGTGKSHAARAIARPFEATVLRSDVIRKELAGLPPDARPADGRETGIYAPEFTRRTYDAMVQRAREHLGHGRTVVIDATCPAASMRAPFLDAARDLGVACVLVETTCPPETVRQRLQQRGGDPDEPSDADWAIYEHARKRFEPPDELAASQCVQVDTRDEPVGLVAAVLDRLVEQ